MEQRLLAVSAKLNLQARRLGQAMGKHALIGSHSCDLASAARGEIAPTPLSRFTAADWPHYGKHDRAARRSGLGGRPDSVNPTKSDRSSAHGPEPPSFASRLVKAECACFAHCQNVSAGGLSVPFRAASPMEIIFGSGVSGNIFTRFPKT